MSSVAKGQNTYRSGATRGSHSDRACKLDKEQAEQLGREIADRMAGHWGGQNIYFPMGLSYKLSQRDQAIYNEFNGINHSELARKHHVSLQWIYKIVKTVQKEETAKRQTDMFL
jgi:Mor family transcriptional regulator